MPHQKVIIVNYQPLFSQPIADRLEFLRGSDENIFLVQTADEALELISGAGPCILITDSIIDRLDHSNPTGAVERMTREARNINPVCKLVMYSIETFNLQEENYDAFINSIPRDSFDELFQKIDEFSKIPAA